MKTPKYQHDCKSCTFLDTVIARHKEVDLYCCQQEAGGPIPTVVARYSDRGSDYSSGLDFADTQAELFMARALAMQRGLLPIVANQKP